MGCDFIFREHCGSGHTRSVHASMRCLVDGRADVRTKDSRYRRCGRLYLVPRKESTSNTGDNERLWMVSSCYPKTSHERRDKTPVIIFYSPFECGRL